ncbi:GH17758 [Drosophila grimshawi]|uniref:GH17758 n=1 Tax=Drosophila grimshawi TaxID=7222 RepID=B4JXL1_DROGR|nr:GH17758 [Drosophila grimshawi]
MDTAKKLWIHCNSCFDFYIDQRIIFLLACQHLACEKCVTASIGRKAGDAPSFMCPICGKRVRGRQVNNALPTNLKDMFHPEPWHDGLPHDVIDTFQKDHRKRLEEHIVKKAKEMEKLYKDMQLAYKVCQKQYVELHRNRMAQDGGPTTATQATEIGAFNRIIAANVRYPDISQIYIFPFPDRINCTVWDITNRV